MISIGYALENIGAKGKAMSMTRESSWVRAATLEELPVGRRKLFKRNGKQIALFRSDKGLFACNNRCPHEGYPLMEGRLSDGCILTCNWHNWKFDLERGETLIGGDRLRRYPVELRDGAVWLDLSDPPPAERAAAALASLRESFRRHEYDRMAREIARLAASGTDPLEALRGALAWTHDRLEFGTTHAIAAAPDWLRIRDGLAPDEAARLVPLVEIVGHLAWDTLREPAYPYPTAVADYAPDALVAAIEQEDEVAAIAQLRGALAAGLDFAALEAPLAQAALAHYQDFGHAAIYLVKTGQLIAALDPGVTEPLLLALVRSLVYASREDLIPEVRGYGTALAAWDGQGTRAPKAEDFQRLSVPKTRALIGESSADPEGLFDALLAASAWQFLHFDLTHQARVDNAVSANVGWLDFTHEITFANAVRQLCGRYPELWPAALLQMGCFLGRNAGYVDSALDTTPWQVDDGETFLDDGLAGLLDHAQAEYIVSSHLVKLLSAVREEIAAAPEAAWVPTLLAATNRFLTSPLKRKHSLRTAKQSLAFVAAEG